MNFPHASLETNFNGRGGGGDHRLHTDLVGISLEPEDELFLHSLPVFERDPRVKAAQTARQVCNERKQLGGKIKKNMMLVRGKMTLVNFVHY